MTNGYLVHFWGGRKAFAQSLRDVKLLVEAFCEVPVYIRDKLDEIVLTPDILEDISSRILYTEIIPVGQGEEIEYPLAEGIEARELFTFTIRIIGDKVKVKLNLRKPSKPKKSE